MASVVEVFPRRPIRLARDPARRNWRVAVLVLVMFGALPSLWWGHGVWQGARLRSDLRDHGVRAAEVMDAEGDCTSRRDRISNRQRPVNCLFNVRYRLRPQEGGAVRTAELNLEGASPLVTPPVLYDPRNPARAMFVPEVDREMSWSELAGPFMLLILPALVLMALLLTSRRRLAAAARDPRPLLVAIEKVVRSLGRTFVHTRAPGATREAVDSFDDPIVPLLVPQPAGAPAGQQWALALQGCGGRHYLLDSDLAWLDLTDVERRTVLAAARST